MPKADEPIPAAGADPSIYYANRQLSRATLIGDVRDLLLDYQKHDKNPLPWPSRSEAEQQQTVARAETFARTLIDQILVIVAAGGRQAVTATRTGVGMTAKGEIQVKAQVAYTRDLWADLGDSNHVLIMPAGSRNPYEGERKPGSDHVEPDQGSLLDGAGDDPDDETDEDEGDDDGDDA